MARGDDTGCQPALAIVPHASAGHTVEIAGCTADPVTPMAVIRPGSAAVIEYVATHPNAIGYVARAHISPQVRIVRVEGLAPDPADIVPGGYPLVQPFFLVSMREPTGAARRFVDFCLSPAGQTIAAEEHVPVRE